MHFLQTRSGNLSSASKCIVSRARRSRLRSGAAAGQTGGTSRLAALREELLSRGRKDRFAKHKNFFVFFVCLWLQGVAIPDWWCYIWKKFVFRGFYEDDRCRSSEVFDAVARRRGRLRPDPERADAQRPPRNMASPPKCDLRRFVCSMASKRSSFET